MTRTATVVDGLRAAYAAFGARAALLDRHRTVTYDELGAAVRRVAAALHARGVGGGDRVAVTPTRSIGQLVCVLGVLEVGAAVAVVDLSADRGARVVAALAPKLLLVDAPVAAFPEAVPFDALPFDAVPDGGARPAGRLPGVPRPEELAYILPTSGTTGGPKLVAMPHAPLAHRIRWAQDAYPIGPGDTVLHAGSLAFDFSLWEIVAPLCAGATVAVAPERAEAEPAELASFIAVTRVTVAHFVPSLLAEFLAATGGDALAGLRLLLLGGERLTADLARRVRGSTGARILNQYGPAEACIDVFCHEVTDDDLSSGGVPIGRPVDGVTAVVIGDDGQPARDGDPGRLWVTGQCLAWGYLGAGAGTAAAFGPAPVGAPGQRWYDTGDRVVRRPDGVFEFLGRLDGQLKIRGVRIELAEVEDALARHPAVQRAAVVAVPRPDGPGFDLVAHAVAEDGLTEATARRHLVDHLVSAAVPGHVVLRSTMPKLPSGKTDRAALAAEGVPSPAPEAGDGPLTETERHLAGEWRDLLGPTEIRRSTDFFQSGGHSLLAMRLTARVRKRYRKPVSARAIFDRPTLAEYSAYVDGMAHTGPPVDSAPGPSPYPDPIGPR